MCELLALSSSHSAHLNISLEALAGHGGRTGRNPDGWGAAFYQDKDVALFREPLPAGDSALVRFVEVQGPRTNLAIAHIRRATRGAVTLSNTQPFARELAGRMHVFAHNGNLPEIDRIGDLTLDQYFPVGATDSEHAFCALLERMRSLWHPSGPLPSVEARLSVVSQFAFDLRKLGPANFLYADGDALFAHGHRRIQADGSTAPPGLFLLSRRCGDATETLHANGVSVGPGFQDVSLIASVPLTDEQWRPLDEGEVLAVSGGQVLATR
jgi:predicted glutamine amidotransferase